MSSYKITVNINCNFKKQLYDISKAFNISNSVNFQFSNSTSDNILFEPYKSIDEILAGIDLGQYVFGFVRFIGPYKNFNAEIDVKISKNNNISRVVVQGQVNLNRVIESDFVAIQILNKNEWIGPNKNVNLFFNFDDYDVESDESIKIFEEKVRSDELLIPTGRVIRLLYRPYKSIVCLVPMKQLSTISKKRSYILVQPVDIKLPKVRVRSNNWFGIQNKKVAVVIDNWSVKSNYPDGHISSILSNDTTSWNDNIYSLLFEYNVNTQPFGIKASACLPKVLMLNIDNRLSNWTIPVIEYTSRSCLNDFNIFSVDPPGCQDIDDAMHVRWLSDGWIEVGVSIADVDYFVNKDSYLDVEAQSRGTTVYLPHKRYDMLPSLISSDIASLHCNRDRLAVTVRWRVQVTHNDGSLVKSSEDVLKLDDERNINFNISDIVDSVIDIKRTIIHSIASMTYIQAHRLIYGEEPNLKKDTFPQDGTAGQQINSSLYGQLAKALRLLTVFSRFLHRRRLNLGAIDIHQSEGKELSFHINNSIESIESPEIASVETHEHLEVHDTIAELMIFTNETVAMLVHLHTPKEALVRIHSYPAINKLIDVYLYSKQMNILTDMEFDITNTDPIYITNKMKEISKKLLHYSNNKSNKDFSIISNIINNMILNIMSEARYVAAGSVNIITDGEISLDKTYLGHYGLGLTYYTHFTSPIRRYADIIVHRQLLNILKNINWVNREGLYPSNKSKQSSKIEIIEEKNKDYNDLDFLLDDISNNKVNQNISNSNIDLLDQLIDNVQNAEICNDNNLINNNMDDFLDNLLSDISLKKIVNVVNKDKFTNLPIENNKSTNLPIESNKVKDNSEMRDIPYSKYEIDKITNHLNVKNRNSKHIQMKCTQLYLSYYFNSKTQNNYKNINRIERHTGIVYNIFSTSLMVYLPKYNYKSVINFNLPGYGICIDPSLLKLPSNYGKELPDNVINLPNHRLLDDFQCESTDQLLRIHSNNNNVTNEIKINIFQKIYIDMFGYLSINNVPSIKLSLGKIEFTNNNNETESNGMDDIIAFIRDIDNKNDIPGNEIKDNLDNTEISIYSICYQYKRKCKRFLDCQSKNNSNNYDNVSETKSNQSSKSIKSIKYEKIHISNSGRIFYGSNEFMPTLFHHFLKSEKDEKNENQKFNRGKILAQDRMYTLGEEWPDEEDLPNNFDSFHVQSDGNIPSQYKKDINNSYQRKNKLKISKKNSKYK